MRAAKLGLTVVLLGFAAMVLQAHQTERFFPWVHAFVLLAGITLLAVAARSGRQDVGIPLAILVATSVALRVYLYLWPASMIGMDPDKYAAGVNRVMETGTVSVIRPHVPIYSTLSAIYTFSGTTSLVAGLEGDAVLIGIPIAMGLTLPYTAAALTRRLDCAPRYSLAAGVLAAFSTVGVLFSYWPISQSIAVLLWFPMLLLLVVGADTDNRDVVVGVVVCLGAAFFAHKLSIFMPFAIVTSAVVFFVLRDRLIPALPGEIRQPYSTFRIRLFAGILAGVLMLQWFYVTEFGRVVLVSQLIPLLTGGSEFVPPVPVYEAATRGMPGVPGILARRAHLLIFIPLVSVAGAWVWARNHSRAVGLIVAASAIPIGLAVLSIAGAGLASPRRTILFGVPIFAVLLVAAAADKPTRVPVRPWTLLLSIAIPLLVIQAASVPLAPDYPDHPRQYLTQGELDGKEFAVDHSPEDVAMDPYYAREQVDVASEDAAISGGSNIEVPGVTGIDGPLLNGELETAGYGAILLRSNVDVIRFTRGGFRLQYDPIYTMDQARDYDRFYDNGDSVGFVG